VAGALALALSAVPVVRSYHLNTLDAFLIPGSMLPKSNAEASAKAAELLAKYPRDPRSHLYQAGALIDRKDLAGAERELRAGLAEEEILRTKFKPEFEGRIRGLLALVLSDGNRHEEAKIAAQPACGITAASFASMRALLLKAQLCEK
jgi:rhomboid protease GluP